MTSQTQSDKDRVVIFDTTLRDGEQCPGATMTHEEKIEVAELLDDMGVDIIEAGFPIASDGDFAAVIRDRQARQERGDLRPLARLAPRTSTAARKRYGRPSADAYIRSCRRRRCT